MKKLPHFHLLVILTLGAMVLSACAGALNGQGINLNDLNLVLTGTVPAHPTDLPEMTGTPEVPSAPSTEVPAVETEKPDVTGTPEAKGASPDHGTPEGQGTPGSDNSHEVLGVVSAIDTTSITVNGVTYYFTNLSVILGTIQVGDTVRLTFGDSNGKLIVHEVKVTDANGSSDGQGNSNNSNSNEGGIHETKTPEPGGGPGGG